MNSRKIVVAFMIASFLTACNTVPVNGENISDALKERVQVGDQVTITTRDGAALRFRVASKDGEGLAPSVGKKVHFTDMTSLRISTTSEEIGRRVAAPFVALILVPVWVVAMLVICPFSTTCSGRTTSSQGKKANTSEEADVRVAIPSDQGTRPSYTPSARELECSSSLTSQEYCECIGQHFDTNSSACVQVPIPQR